MKNVILGLVCAIVVMACGMEIPQSITIQGKPEFKLSLGSPFDGLAEDKRIETQISGDKIKEMMDTEENAAKGIGFYEYIDPASARDDILTYIIHYPLAEMKLDLEEYIGDAMKGDDAELQEYAIPDFVSGLLQSQIPTGGLFLTPSLSSSYQPEGPLFTFYLTDMYKLVKTVYKNEVALQIPIVPGITEASLAVSVPAFGIGSKKGDPIAYVTGTIEGEMLVFKSTEPTTFYPRQHLNADGGFEVFVKALEPCSGIIAPEMQFIWESALIDTSGDEGSSLADSYVIENALGDFLGTGVSFRDVYGYIYVDGIDNDGKERPRLALEVIGKTGAKEVITTVVPGPEGRDELENAPRPPFPVTDVPITVTLPDDSLGYAMDLKSVLAGSSATLYYKIDIPEWEIYYEDNKGNDVITADLIIVLPLILDITEPSSLPGYVKLDLELFSTGGATEDLFGRTGDDDGLLSNLEWVEIAVTNTNISILDESKLAILLTANGWKNPVDPESLILKLGDPNSSLKLYSVDMPNPFNPNFEVLVERDSQHDHSTPGILEIFNGTDPSFNFDLTLAIKADINETINF